MREIDRLKWAIYCGYNPYKRLYLDCSGLSIPVDLFL